MKTKFIRYGVINGKGILRNPFYETRHDAQVVADYHGGLPGPLKVVKLRVEIVEETKRGKK